MTVVKAEIKADGRKVDFDFLGVKIDGNPLIGLSGSLTYNVYCDSATDGPATAIASPELPTLGDCYTENGVVYYGSRVEKARPRFVGVAGNLWLWEVEYPISGQARRSSDSGEDGEGDATLLQFSASLEREDYASPVDLDGRWNRNSLGEWFSEPINLKNGALNLSYRRSESANPLAKSALYYNAVNDSELWGFAPGTVKVEKFDFSASKTTSTTTYEVDYLLQYRPIGWNELKANAGLYASDGSSIYRVLNDDGSPKDSPILLDATGAPLAFGAAPVYLTFRTTYPRDLAALGLPNPFDL